MHGHTASGKSSLALRLAATLPNAGVFHSARIRSELGLRPRAGGGAAPAYRFDLSDPTFTRTVSGAVYDHMLSLAQAALSSRCWVILDAAFNFTWQREPVYRLGMRLLVPVIAIRCICPDEDEVRRRLLARREREADDLSEASEWETYLSTRAYADDLMSDLGLAARPDCIVEFDSLLGESTVLASTLAPGHDRLLDTLRAALGAE